MPKPGPEPGLLLSAAGLGPGPGLGPFCGTNLCSLRVYFHTTRNHRSMQTRLFAVLAALGSAAPLAAQVAQPSTTAPARAPHFDSTGVGDTSMFAPLMLPSAN